MVEGRVFQTKTIPKRATELAIRLSSVLAPVFSAAPQDPAELDWGGFATWGSDLETIRERKQHLVDMFTLALKTKAESCLNIEIYEMANFASGSKYDKRSMDVQTREGVRCQTGSFEGRKVEQCIQPAIYAYLKGELSRNCSIAEATVSMKNFLVRTESERADVIPHVRGLVVLSDAI